MTDAEAREKFDEMRSKTDDPELKAWLELLREWYTNPKFRKALADHTFKLTYNPTA